MRVVVQKYSISNCKKPLFNQINFLFNQNISKHTTGLINRNIEYSKFINFKPISIYGHSSPKYSFSTQKKTQQKTSQSQHSTHMKLLQMKTIFQTKMNTYNIKALLRIHQVLSINHIKLSQQSIQKFQYRLTQQLSRLDHQDMNSILEILYRKNHVYQKMGKDKILRGINLKLQKNKVNFQQKHIYKTIILLGEMNFPKSTLGRVFYKLVMEDQIDKRILYQMDNLKALKVSLICMENVEIQLQTKKRVLQNLLKIKTKGLIQLVYFYTILKTSIVQLQKTVKYESQKKSVYDLAFNPYNSFQIQQSQSQPATPSQQVKQKQKQKPKVEDSILKRLLSQKQKVLQQTFQKINLQKVSEQINFLMKQILQNKQVDEVYFLQKKQICLILISNSFADENNGNKKILIQMIQTVLNEGLNSNKGENHLDSTKIIRVSEFVLLLKMLDNQKQSAFWFDKYSKIYSKYMNLLQSLIFTYHKSKMLRMQINLQEIKQKIQNVQYGLNPQEFSWLNKVFSFNKQKHSSKDQQVIKQIWLLIEKNLDQEMEILKSQTQNKQNDSSQNSQNKNSDNSQKSQQKKQKSKKQQ